jgi:hypothetical protein
MALSPLAGTLAMETHAGIAAFCGGRLPNPKIRSLKHDVGNSAV